MTKSLHGVLILNKPASWTSHDVVAKVRGIFREKQIGHLGTLDPLATGVLPLAVGSATRLIEYASFPKSYTTTCLLGRTTDSGDITGKTLSEKPAGDLSADRIRQETLKLKELIEQVPPMVSALKKDGRKLYELAREGVEVERKARPIHISELEVLSVEPPRVSFRLTCSPGTYVRSLCMTLGEALGVGGCMEELERTGVGPFKIQDAVSLQRLEEQAVQGKADLLLRPSSDLVAHLPKLELGEGPLREICQGKAVKAPGIPEGRVRILNTQGRLVAIAEGTVEGELQPRKVFGMDGIL